MLSTPSIEPVMRCGALSSSSSSSLEVRPSRATRARGRCEAVVATLVDRRLRALVGSGPTNDELARLCDGGLAEPIDVGRPRPRAACCDGLRTVAVALEIIAVGSGVEVIRGASRGDCCARPTVSTLAVDPSRPRRCGVS